MTTGDTALRKTHAPGLQRNQSLQKAVAILRALSEVRTGATTAELAVAVELPSPTLRRLLATLSDAGMVEQIPDTGQWVIGHELLRLGRAADPFVSVVGRARPHLESMMATAGETVLLGANRLPYAVDVIAQVDPGRMVGIGNWLGRPVQLHASAGSRVALSTLPDDDVRAILGIGPYLAYTDHTITDPERLIEEIRRVRETGVSIGVDELEVGMTTIAVPVHAHEQDQLFALAVCGPTFRLDRARRAELVPHLQATASAIAAAIEAA
ncbi:MAG: IclR family transcriptional regulator [Gaiellales bacterium]